MGCLGVAARALGLVLVTWLTLIVMLLLPSLLPVCWHYYIYSPASVGLWLLAMLAGPIVVLIAKREWIRTGRRA